MSQEKENKFTVSLRVGSSKQEFLVYCSQNLPVSIPRVVERVEKIAKLDCFKEAFVESGEKDRDLRVISDGENILGFTLFNSKDYPTAV